MSSFPDVTFLGVDTMARTIYGEARNQGFYGKVAVGFVIRTRSEERKLTVSQVCLQPLQFSCWNIGDPNRDIVRGVSLNDRAFVECYGIACLVLTGNLSNPVPGANHYHTLGVKPYWSDKMVTIKIIGSHRFLKG